MFPTNGADFQQQFRKHRKPHTVEDQHHLEIERRTTGSRRRQRLALRALRASRTSAKDSRSVRSGAEASRSNPERYWPEVTWASPGGLVEAPFFSGRRSLWHNYFFFFNEKVCKRRARAGNFSEMYISESYNPMVQPWWNASSERSWRRSTLQYIPCFRRCHASCLPFKFRYHRSMRAACVDLQQLC